MFFSQVNFFQPFSNFLQKINCNPLPCMAQKSYVPPHAKRYDRDYVLINKINFNLVQFVTESVLLSSLILYR